jgi:SAM-dependent methyltransferase
MGFYSDLAAYYEAIFPYRDEVYDFLKSHLPAGARRVLDVGCGTGHYCGRLAADGFDVVGIDLDPQMIDTARRRYPAAAFESRDMLEVGTLPPGFDLIFCIGNSAPHVTQADFTRLIGDIARLLAPGGVWLFQIVNYDFILTHQAYAFPPRTLKGGEAVFSREYRDISDSQLRFHTRLVAGRQVVFEGEVWLYPMRSAAYLAVHAQRGFQLIEHVADFQRRPFDPASESGSIFVFRKPRV